MLRRKLIKKTPLYTIAEGAIIKNRMRKRYKRLLSDTKLQYELSGSQSDKKRVMYLEERLKACKK